MHAIGSTTSSAAASRLSLAPAAHAAALARGVLGRTKVRGRGAARAAPAAGMLLELVAEQAQSRCSSIRATPSGCRQAPRPRTISIQRSSRSPSPGAVAPAGEATDDAGQSAAGR